MQTFAWIVMIGLVVLGGFLIGLIAMLIIIAWALQPVHEADQTVPLFETDPLDDGMVLPAAWPADNVTDITGRPFFVGRS